MTAVPRRLDVLTLADEAFAIPLAVLGRSIADHLDRSCIARLSIVDGGLSMSSKQRCLASWDDRIDATFIPASATAWAGLAVRGRIPLLTFERLRVGTLLPPDCERALILDADQLVRADIRPLFDLAFEGAVAFAPVDAFIPTLGSPLGLRNPQGFGLSADLPFLCGAVVMLDVDAWRRKELGTVASGIVREHHDALSTYDQDALNIVLAKRWRPLDPRWQHQPRLANLAGAAEGSHFEPFIVHFSGRLKPWLFHGSTRWDRLFFETLDRTAFRGSRPRASLRSLLWRLYDSPVRRFLYPLEWRIERVFRQVRRRSA